MTGPAEDAQLLRAKGDSVAKKKDRYVIGLDIGTHKVCAIVAEATEEGRLDVIGIGQTESKGLRKGVVINLEATVESIKRVVEEAELMAGVEIGSAYVGIAGTHIRGFNSRGVIAISGKSRIIDRESVARSIDAAKAVSIPMDREILHVLPQEFVVDDQDGIGDPVGMTGTRLEVNVHVVTCASTSAQNTVTCVNRAGLEVIDTVLTQISAAEACLTPDEKELGVALVDIGGGTTDIAIFEKGSLWHTAVLQVGGEHFTNDVAVALRTPVNEAEKIKRKHGCALTSMIPEEDSIEVPSVGGRKPRIMARQVLGDVIQARAEEICQMVLTEIRRAGFDRSLNSGVVLTGGGAILEGMPEIAEQIFDMPVRRGTPAGIGGLVDVVASPVYSTAVGLVLCGHRNRAHLALGGGRQAATGTFGKVTGRLMGWFTDFF
jgi:cell division protein FtsA